MKILIVNGHYVTGIGGSEIQCDLIARHLPEFGHEVIYAAVGADAEAVAGAQPEHPYPMRPFPRYDVRALRRLLADTRPDLVYWRLRRTHLPGAGLVCRAAGIPLVFSVSAIPNVRRLATRIRFRRGDAPVRHLKNAALATRDLARSALSYEALRLVDGLVVLSDALMEEIQDSPQIPRRRVRIYDSMDDTCEGDFEWPRPYVVWVANLTRIKNPQRYLEVAEQLAERDVDFLMIGRIHDEEFRFVEDPARLPANVHYLGPRPLREVNAILAGSEMLVHTCDPEGFGNNFIQAWQQGKPTVTLYFDPDDLMKRHDIGRHSGSMPRFVADIEALLDDAKARREMGARARRVARDLFDPRANVRRMAAFFEAVALPSQEDQPATVGRAEATGGA